MNTTLTRRTLAVAAVTGTLVSGAVAAPALAAPTAASTPAAPAGAAAAQPASATEKAVMKLLNQQRAAHGLPPLSRSGKLVNAALGHNKAMAAADTLSHQLPGEPSFDQRITNAGYTWSAAAENIGYTTQTTQAGAISIQKAFYNEVPPNDGHRRNILATNVTQVGVSVYVANGKLWITEDFAAPR